MPANINKTTFESLIKSLYNTVFVYARMISNNYNLNYLTRHDKKLSQAPRLDGFLQRFVHWPNENKEADLAGRWVRRDLS